MILRRRPITALTLDIAIIIILLLSAGISAYRGLIKEVLTIVALIGASFAGYVWGTAPLPYFEEMLIDLDDPDKQLWGLISMDTLASICSYGSVVLGVFIILTLISFFISKAVREMGLGAVDRSLGVVFGLFRGLVLVSLIYVPFSTLMKEDGFPEWTHDSKAIPVIQYSVNKTYEFFDIEKMDSDALFDEDGMDSEDLLNSVKDLIPEKSGEENSDGYEKDVRSKLNNLIQDNLNN